MKRKMCYTVVACLILVGTIGAAFQVQHDDAGKIVPQSEYEPFN